MSDKGDYKQFQNYVEQFVDDILYKNVNLTAQEDQINDIVDNIMQSPDVQNLTEKLMESFDGDNQIFEPQNYVINLENADALCPNFDLDNVITHLINNKEMNTKIKALRSLLNFPLTELTDTKHWPRLSRVLREYLMGKNIDLYSISLEIHRKLVSYTHTIHNGFTNIIKTLATIFNTKKGYFVCDDGNSSKSIVNSNILKIVDLLLKTLCETNKLYSNKDKLLETFVNDFMELICYYTYYDKCDTMHIINYLSVLDPQALWFNHIIYNLTSRNIIFNFCRKNPSFIRYLITKLTTSINFTLPYESKSFTKMSVPDLNMNIINFATFSACGHIISYMFQYKQILEFFPVSVKTHERSLSDYALIISIITAINNLEFARQKPKRQVLTNVLKTILIKNNYYLSHKEVAYLLMRPLHFSATRKNTPAEIAAENTHVYEICSHVNGWRDGFLIMFGLLPNVCGKKRTRISNHKMNRSVSLTDQISVSYFIEKYLKSQGYTQSAKDKDSFIPGKIIIEFTTTLMRHHINLHDFKINDGVFTKIFDGCYNIYSSHSHVFLMVNSHKFIWALKDLYKFLIDNGQNHSSLMRLLCLMCASYNGLDLVKDDSDLVYVLSKEYLTAMQSLAYNDVTVYKFLSNVSHTSHGEKAISESNKYIIQTYLNDIWMAIEDEFMFVCGSNRKVDEAVFQLLKVVFQINLNSKCVQALVSGEAKDDDDTVVDTDYALNLQDLLHDSLSDSGPGSVPCFVGLMIIKVLILNLDTLAYLEQMLRLQEKLEVAQLEYKSSNEDVDLNPCSEVIIDDCSMLRNNLINSIKCPSTDTNDESSIEMKIKLSVSRSAISSSRKKPLNDLQRFLNDSRNNLHDTGWLVQARKCYRGTVKDILKEQVVLDLIHQVKSVYPPTKLNYIWTNNEVEILELRAEESKAVLFIVRYGIQNGLLQPCNPNEENLTFVLKQVKGILDLHKSEYAGFDWFVSVIFLLCGGHVDRTKTTLQNILGIPSTPYFWYVLGKKLQMEKKHNILTHLDCGFSLMIEDLDSINNALQGAGIPWNSLAHTWLKQCFLNSLDWKDICHFVTICVLFPPDYILFCFASIAVHLESTIYKAVSCNDINLYKKIFSLHGFQICDYLSFMDQLGKQHKNILSSQ